MNCPKCASPRNEVRGSWSKDGTHYHLRCYDCWTVTPISADAYFAELHRRVELSEARA